MAKRFRCRRLSTCSTPASERLRKDVLSLPGRVAIVANSLGAFLPAYIGATDPQARLRNVRAIYLNPLIGGSRYADADRALAVLGEVPGLGWLYGVKRLIQRAFFPRVVQDLAPESDYQQVIFGLHSCASSFARGTMILFTERGGEQPGIRDHRFRRFFGRSRAELVARMGQVLPVETGQWSGHDAPLVEPEIVLRPIRKLLEWAGERSVT